MKKFIIERELPGAGDLSAEDLKNISQKSCGVLAQMGPSIQWLESYVTTDKIYCVYVAESEEQVREHAKCGEFPANYVTEVATMIGPETTGPAFVPGR